MALIKKTVQEMARLQNKDIETIRRYCRQYWYDRIGGLAKKDINGRDWLIFVPESYIDINKKTEERNK